MAEGPGEVFTLIGGDIPSIQDLVYTITSKAAKGLRGHFLCMQLVGDAAVRRLLADLALCPGNVIYHTSGNHVGLEPAGIEESVQAIAAEVNGARLSTFERDLALCLACHALPAGQVGRGTFG